MREMNAKKVTITMIDGTVFRGSINIGNSRRISDHLKKNENMFAVFDATMNNGDDKDVYFVSSRHVLWVKPDEKLEKTQSKETSTIGIKGED